MTTKDILAIQVSTISSGSLISWNGSSFTSIPSANVGPIEIFKVGKTIDENKTGNTVASDTELTISFSEVGLYSLDSEIHFTANLGVGIKYRYYLTSGVGNVTWHSAFNPPFALISGTSTNSINGAGTKRGFSTRGFIEVTSAPAVLYFQWSQDSTDLLNPTTVHKGSWILATKTA